MILDSTYNRDTTALLINFTDILDLAANIRAAAATNGATVVASVAVVAVDTEIITDEPTDEPSAEPSAEPSDAPTAKPSEQPTTEPTAPHEEPTTSPTYTPYILWQAGCAEYPGNISNSCEAGTTCSVQVKNTLYTLYTL